MPPTLVILAAGLATRYGGLKQLEPVGPSGEALLDYAVYDAARAGIRTVVFVTREDLEHSIRNHAAQCYGEAITVDTALQRIDSVPHEVSVPPDRARPWGTGHAVLAVAQRVTGSFVVINADDFYGRSSFQLLTEHLARAAPGAHALVGYRVGDTLSTHGGVSRAVCACSEGRVTSLVEWRDVKREPDGRIMGGDHARRELSRDDIVSMNCWGFTPEVFEGLADAFARFLSRHASDPEAEFLIGPALHDLVSEGRATVHLLRAGTHWFGMTYPADRADAAARLAALVDDGQYPRDLRAGFARLSST